MSKTLVVMAAGMGSRFGGLKQLTPIDDNGNFIIDYSVYDAIKAGFDKVVFVIKKEIEEEFKKTIGKRIEDKIEVSYAYQNIEDIPIKDKSIIDSRKKPWGTVQAVLASKDYVDGDFAVINADDFYGYDSYRKIVEFLDSNNKPFEYASVLYPFYQTRSECGKVNRGVCKIEDGLLKDVVESSIILENDYAIATTLTGDNVISKIAKDALVNMNIMAFKHDFYGLLEEYFKDYFKQDRETIINGESFLPSCVEKNIHEGVIKVYALENKGRWLGITYKEDLEMVKKEINMLVQKGEYPNNLWN